MAVNPKTIEFAEILADAGIKAVTTSAGSPKTVVGFLKDRGIKVLHVVANVANAVKAVHLPGETMTLQVIQEGKEYNQGVGYLDDGTMVVVEDGRPLIGQTIDLNVTKVLQTAAGRMIFAKPEVAR